MEYTLSMYHILLSADNLQRNTHQITTHKLCAYIEHACQLLNSKLYAAHASQGHLQMLIALAPGIAIDEFVGKLELWTSIWIKGDVGPSFWQPAYHARTVSPEDKLATIVAINDTPAHISAEHTADSQNLSCHSPGHGGLPAHPHHIIFTTSRARLLLPAKHRHHLIEAMGQACQRLGIKQLEGAAMRNHVHLLCQLPASMPLTHCVDNLKAQLSSWMLSRAQFRKVAEWSPDFWAYTVSAERLSEVKMQILRQDEIHGYGETANEMSVIYQLLGVPYIVSLH